MKALLGALALITITTLGAAAPICGMAYATACCKTCSKGKACGDTCIARDRNCTRGPGCACNG